MSNLKCFNITLVFLLIVNFTSAQNFVDRGGKVLGHISSEGYIRSEDGMRMGSIEKGIIKNEHGTKIGELWAGGIVKDKKGDLLGTVDSTGLVKDPQGIKLGTIDSTGIVMDRKDRRMGEAKGIKREYAAVFFFFFEFL